MPITVKEVNKFDKGIHSSISELDISSESASLSLNIDPNSEYGALRGIYGDKVLDFDDGWVAPRYAKWDIKFFGTSGIIPRAILEKKLFMMNAYDKQFLLVFLFDDSLASGDGIHADAFYNATESNLANGITDPDITFNLIPIKLETYLAGTNIYAGNVADALKTALDEYALASSFLESITGHTNEFYCYRPSSYATDEELLEDGTLTILSNFIGDVGVPFLPTDSFPYGGLIEGTDLADTDGVYFPNLEVYGANSTKFVKGTGLALNATLSGLDSQDKSVFNYAKLKAFNSKGDNRILGINSDGKIDIISGLGGNVGSIGNIGPINNNPITIEQRNKNLYLGVGNSSGTFSRWIGYLDRPQLDRQLEGYYLERNSVDSISTSVGSYKYDNMVVPTLHHGLNSTNGGIAGAASLYCGVAEGEDADGDVSPGVGTETYHHRSVNGWVRQCIKNSTGDGTTYNAYDDIKEGMIFRVDLGLSVSAGAYSSYTTSAGLNAYAYLRELKRIAKGHFSSTVDTSANQIFDTSDEGGTGETLHDGDLFQVVYSLGTAAAIAFTGNNDSIMFRLVFVGSLFGKEGKSAGNSTEAFCGIPAYTYAHNNDSENLVRIKTTGKSTTDIKSTYTNSGGYSSIIKNTEGGYVPFSKNRLDSINLKEELGVSDFHISTIAECKSSNGEGGFGGDTTNKNYFTGTGKLWIANKNEPLVLYLVDVTNWDKHNSSKNRLTFQKINLNFDRIHSHLLSHDNTEDGNGLIQLWEQDNTGSSQDTELEYFSGYTWNHEPNGKFISSICETYSHLPHLGDGAGGGDSNGDGKWRVWVEYSNHQESAHIRYDLFLYNFRPQPWTGEDNDTGSGITSTNKSVFMFDKTPPYQECQSLSIAEYEYGGSHRTVYFPFDKCALMITGSSTDRAHLGPYSKGPAGIGSYTGTDAAWGMHRTIRAKGNSVGDGGKFPHGHTLDHGTLAIIGSRILRFRNPSGEYHDLKPPNVWWALSSNSAGYARAMQTCEFPLGGNLGWVLDDGRQYQTTRHTLKPYYRKWYFTGNGGSNDADLTPYPEEEPYLSSGKKTYTAHVVSSFGKLTGKFVENGGVLIGARGEWGSNSHFNNQKDRMGWFGRFDGKIKTYDDTYVMINMHDSPVAITSYGAGSTAYEVQGAPSSSIGKEIINLTDSLDRTYYKDTEAGFMGNRTVDGNGDEDVINHSTVSATMGYSVYNQYRHNYAHSGTLNVDDNDEYNSSGDYANGETHGYGGQYYGSDGYGHYNMITQTWACNQDFTHVNSYVSEPTVGYSEGSLSNYKVFDILDPEYYDFDSHARIHGIGDGTYFRSNNVRSDDGKFWIGTNDSLGYEEDEGNSPLLEVASRYGTGYFTYKANTHSNTNDCQTIQSDYYPYTGTVDNSNNFKLKGTPWDNRRIVHCWSTTALTDSIHNYNYSTARGLNNLYDHREWGLWKTPRCSFRELDIPSEFGTDGIILKSVDTITWAQRNVNDPDTDNKKIIKSGYIGQFELEEGQVSDEDNSSTGVIVWDTKTNSNRSWNETWPWNDDSAADNLAYGAHCKLAIDPLKRLTYLDGDGYSKTNIYSSTNLFFKNLVPGLSDDIEEYGTNHDRGQFANEFFKAKEDTYCPMVISQAGSEEKQSLSTWFRPQFDSTNDVSDSLGTYPFYKFDKLWNYWSSAENSGFDRAHFDTLLYPTEGFGSTAGSSLNASQDDSYYPSTYTATDSANSLKSVGGSHIKEEQTAVLELDSHVADEDDVEFPLGEVFYKFTLLYDGFQESTLSFNDFTISVPAKSRMLRLILTLPNASSLGINSRVTHINLYRRNNINEMYRLIKSFNLNLNKSNWEISEAGNFTLNFNDSKRLSSYEGLNGIPESLTNLTPNYSLSCQLNDFLFISVINHPELEEGDHLMLRSKQGRFSIFDWSNDFLDLPTKPTAMAAFANRVWVFDNNNIYKINPTGLYLEDRTEGIGILNSDSVIVTDIGMFWCDRNNVYKHDGSQLNQIGTSILKNHANPEWQLGYLDAVNKSEELGFTPKIAYDSINQCIYIAIQGVSKTFLSYKKYDSRIYSYDIKQDRWDYYDSPGVKSITSDGTGAVVITDGYQIYNYRRDKRNTRKFSWDSKSFQLGSSNYDKKLKALKFTGDLCLWKFNNSGLLQNYASESDDAIIHDDFQVLPDYETGDNTHILEITNASEDDDLKVYVDGILQTMRIKNNHPVLGPPIANDSTGIIYKVEEHLPEFETKGNLDYEDSFSLLYSNAPEFLSWPNGQFKDASVEGGIMDLIHIHRGMYLYFKGVDKEGVTIEEIVKVRDIKIKWIQTSDGVNPLDTGQAYGAITIRTWRGQLGTLAYNWSNSDLINSTDIQPIRTVSPKLLFPKGAKGKTIKVSLQNQKSFIDSFAISYRLKKFK